MSLMRADLLHSWAVCFPGRLVGSGLQGQHLPQLQTGRTVPLLKVDLLGYRQDVFLVTTDLLGGRKAMGCGRVSDCLSGLDGEADQKEGGIQQGE